MWWNRGLRKHNLLKTGIILLPRPSVREPMRWIRGLHKHNLLKTGIILLPMWWNRGLRKHNRLKTGIILLHSGRRRRDVMPEPEWVTGYSFLTGPI